MRRPASAPASRVVRRSEVADAGRLGAETLMRMATHYLSRHSASTARLRDVLARKIAKRSLAGETDPPDAEALAALVDPVVERLQRIGLLDDAAFARGRAASLAAKGRPAWRIKADLSHGFGVDAAAVGLSDTLDALDALRQATRWAQRRRLGPFRSSDRAGRRDRDIASLARAGFAVDIARAVIDGASSDGETDGG